MQTRILRPSWRLSVLLLAFHVACSMAEDQDEDVDWMESNEDFATDEETVDAASEGEEVVAIFCIVFGVCLMFVGLCMAHFSILEDGLMRIYVNKGLDLRATVLEASFCRGEAMVAETDKPATPSSSEHENSKGQSRDEYTVFIEYRLPKEKYTVTKQVKALEVDLKEGPTVPKAIQLDVEQSDPTTDSSNHVPARSCQTSMGGIHGLDVYVLESYPKSAMPQRQAERTQSIRYRLPTLLLVVFLLILSVASIRLGLGQLPDLLWGLSPDKGTVVLATILTLTEVLCINFCLGDMFRSALREMYLDDGECCAPDSWDETSLSSKDDSYLKM